MLVSNIVDEDFVNYKKPSMFIGTAYCDWKCCVEGGFSPSICQNHTLVSAPRIDVSAQSIVDRFMKNPITEAIVFGGLEPMLQIDDVLQVVHALRAVDRTSYVIIYTGYEPYEVMGQLDRLCHYNNIIVKFGRYKPNSPSIYDAVLGVELASENQYAKKIS